MKKGLTITDLTRMHHDRVCIAGYTDDGTCIRPTFKSGHLTEDWLWLDDNVIVRPFAKVELDFTAPIPSEPHTEDWIVDPLYRVSSGVVSVEDRNALMDQILDLSVEEIFGARLHYRIWESFREGCWIAAGQGNRSLGTIKPRPTMKVFYGQRPNGKWDYRISFVDRTGTGYNLPVVDLAFRSFIDLLREGDGLTPDEAADVLTLSLREYQVYLRIGLARGWSDYPDRCYVQVTGVHSFPDYLDGLCFADFRPSTVER